MCYLKLPLGFSQQTISKSLTPESLKLKKQNDKRAFALLKAIAMSQVTASQDLSKYPTLQAALNERKLSK